MGILFGIWLMVLGVGIAVAVILFHGPDRPGDCDGV